MKPTRSLLIAAALLIPAALHAGQRDPKALAALQRMSTSLTGAKAFTVRMHSMLEAPIKTGQFVTLFSTGEIALQRPNKVRARLGGEAPRFDFYYDGTNVSAYAPGSKVYSTIKAPSTIDLMLPDLERETGIRLVTAPLLFSDPYKVLTRGLTSAVVIGPTAVHGVPCEHLAFRSPGVNWEIWIESGPRALPRRLATTFTDRPNFPRTVVEFSNWNLHPWLRSGDFVFRPPAGIREIPFSDVMKLSDR